MLEISWYINWIHDNYPCLVESDKQQINEVRNKTKVENSETKATSKRVRIRPMHSASVAFSRQEDKYDTPEQTSSTRVQTPFRLKNFDNCGFRSKDCGSD